MNKQVKYVFVLIGVCVSLAVPEVSPGTTVVIYLTQDKIIVAADSRALSSTGLVDDTVCKISALGGQFLFASAGFTAYGELHPAVPVDDDSIPGWSSDDFARRAFAHGQVVKDSLIQGIAAEWTDSMLITLRTMYRYDPRSMAVSAEMGDGKLIQAVFGGIENGSLKLFKVEISFDKMQSQPVQVSNSGFITCTLKNFCVIGEPDTVIEFLDQITKRSRNEASTWKPNEYIMQEDRDIARAMRFVELAILYQEPQVMPGGRKENGIGGPIDAVELTRTGKLRWYCKKKSCPDN